MINVVHVIDQSCRADVLLEASRLADAQSGGLLCLGSPPEQSSWKEVLGGREILATVPASALSARAARGLDKRLPADCVVQCWSIDAAMRMTSAGLLPAAAIAVRVASAPTTDQVQRLAALAGSKKLALACRGEWFARPLREADIPAATEVIPPLVVPVRQPPDRQELRDQLGIAPEHTAILAPGEADRASGHKYAVWAAAILTVAEVPVRLIFQEDQPGIPAATRFADETGFREQLTLAGRNMSLEELAAAANAAVFLGTDQAPLAALATVMAAGLPIVAADISPDGWLANEVNALLVRPDVPRPISQALMRIIEEEPLAEQLGRQARSFAAENFQAANVLGDWRKLYEQLHDARAG